jgi:hypothetical protein
MHRLVFPFWVVMRTHRGDPVDACAPLKYAATFSSTTKAGDLMQALGGKNWEFLLVIRAGMPGLIADLAKAGFEGLCFDPNADGTGGKLIPLVELQSQI